MRANSRNSILWSIATAVVALALGALPATFDADGDAIAGKAALADGGGNGRLVAVNPMPPPDAAPEQGQPQPAPPFADDARHSRADETDQRLGNGDDGDGIGDDSDIASVDGSANDSDAAQNEAGPLATAAESAAGAPGDFSDETF
jgi:hypothetical protein